MLLSLTHPINGRNLIENSIVESKVVDDSTKKLIETFPPEFKDLILESVLKQIISDPAMKARFQKELKNTLEFK